MPVLVFFLLYFKISTLRKIHVFPSHHHLVHWTSSRPKETLRSLHSRRDLPLGDVKTTPSSLSSLHSDSPGSDKFCTIGQTCTFRKGPFHLDVGLEFLLWEVFTHTLDSLHIRGCLFFSRFCVFLVVFSHSLRWMCAPQNHRRPRARQAPRGTVGNGTTSVLFEVAVITATPAI